MVRCSSSVQGRMDTLSAGAGGTGGCVFKDHRHITSRDSGIVSMLGGIFFFFF